MGKHLTLGYRVLGLVGEGGFGKVYRARMEGPEGFVKDVAIKVLRDGCDDKVLQRFRDESRIMGLVRDRGVVAVEAPVELVGRWAIIMEYADGTSLSRLIRGAGALPPAVALELVMEIARLLDSVYKQPGPDNLPLELIHRDLKPSNIQISRSGEVRVLDFGIARATFSGREASTTSKIGGTLGYIAPERLHGVEGPEGDIFSLGVILAQAVLGKPRPAPRAEGQADEIIAKILDYADRMSSGILELRPTAREVERWCRNTRAGLDGDGMREWCETHVDEVARELDGDEFVGAWLERSISVPSVTTADLTQHLPMERLMEEELDPTELFHLANCGQCRLDRRMFAEVDASQDVGVAWDLAKVALETTRLHIRATATGTTALITAGRPWWHWVLAAGFMALGLLLGFAVLSLLG